MVEQHEIDPKLDLANSVALGVAQQRIDPKLDLAISVARGVAVSRWANDQGVPKRTAYRWAEDAEFKAEVEKIRRRDLDQAIGFMTHHTAWAANEIKALAISAESESVKLRALRSIFSDMMEASHHSNIASRLSKIEEHIRDKNG